MFIAIGVVNTLFGYGLYVLFIWFGLHYAVAVVFSTILGVLFNFKTISIWVFDNSNSSLLFKFVLMYVVVFFVNIGIIKLAKMIDYSDYIGGLIALGPCAILSFMLNKFFVYKKQGG